MPPRNPNPLFSVLGAAGLGAAVMYFLDPDRGARRRAIVRDKVARAIHEAGDAAGTASRDLVNRTRGLAAGAYGFVDGDEADDDVIEARVRSEIGRVVSHPGAIQVRSGEGRVTLSGDVLLNELDDLIACVGRVRGVTGVSDQLHVHETPDHVASLQGNIERGYGPDFIDDQWTPASRLLTTIVGGALAFYGVRRRDSFGAAIGLTGLGLLTRGTTNQPLRRVVGAGGGRRGIEVEKTLNIHAPVGEVFSFLTAWESFPHWMTHVREVRASGPRGEAGERTHWVVDGPLGAPVAWDAITTRFLPNELVAWKSEKGAAVRQAGRIRFDDMGGGVTRVQVQLRYLPPAGMVGHALASLFGRDPKRQMNDDLARIRTAIEAARAPRDVERPLPVATGPADQPAADAGDTALSVNDQPVWSGEGSIPPDTEDGMRRTDGA
jgi:uncharacterized membrane protein